MTKKITALVLSLVMIFSCMVASAGVVSGSGTTNGGTLGKTAVSATMTYTNSTSAGGDKTAGKTESDAAGSLGVMPVIWYTGPKGNGSNSDSVIKPNTRSVSTSVKAPSASHGYKSTSGHNYVSDNYGSWGKGLSYTF